MEQEQAAFTRQVRHALARVYDPAALRTHPLGRLLGLNQAAPPAERADALRQRLLAAIARLQPDGAVASSHAWRMHRLLQLRYLEAQRAGEVARALALSSSQYYREHERALAALAALLWEPVPVQPNSKDVVVAEPERQNPLRYVDGAQAAATTAGPAPTTDDRPTAKASAEVQVGGPLAPALAPLASPPPYRGAFVGREAELQQLRATCDGTLAGAGALAMVEGEPGIGKTALCEQLAAYGAERGARILVGHCYEENSLPYLPFVEALGAYVLERDAAELGQDLGSGAAELTRLIPEIRQRLPLDSSHFPSDVSQSTDTEPDRWRLYQALVGFLRNSSMRQPLVLVLEDLHWAERGTLDLLLHLSRQLAGARLLLVSTYRDVEVDRTHPLAGTLAALRRTSGFMQVALRGLPTPDVQRLLGKIAGEEVSGSLADAVYHQTEGNPLFVREVARYLIGEGLLAGGQRPDADQRESLSAMPPSLPAGLQDVIGDRLSRLGTECNRVLVVGAVIGREFALATLQQVASLADDVLLAALEEATRAGVLDEEERMGQVRYRFCHALFRQHLYGEISAPRRVLLHQQVARALEDHYAGQLDEHAAELAGHFAHSPDRVDLARAVDYAERAAQRAMAVFAPGEAARLLEQAVEVHELVAASDRGRLCDLLLAQANALTAAGQSQRALTAIAPRAFALAEELGDRQRAFAVAEQAVGAFAIYGGTDVMGTDIYRLWADRVWAAAGENGATRIQALLARASVFFADGQSTAAWDVRWQAVAEARALADAHLLFRVAHTLFGAGVTPPRHLAGVLDLASEYHDWLRGGGDDGALAPALWYGGARLLQAGDRPGAEWLWERLEDLALRTRLPIAVYYVQRSAIVRAVLAGQFEAAETAATELRALADEQGAPARGRQHATNTVYRALLYRGRASEGLAQLPTVSENPERVAQGWAAAGILCRAYLGPSHEAADLLEQTLRTLDPAEAVEATLALLLEAAVLLRSPAAVAVLMPPLASIAETLAVVCGPTCIARLLGEGAAVLGDRAKARAYYEQAWDLATRVGHRPEIAIIHLCLAELLLEGGPGDQADVAIEHLDTAAKELRAMEMHPYLERALRYRDRLDASAGRSPARLGGRMDV